MKSRLVLFFLSLITLNGMAQFPGGGFGGGPRQDPKRGQVSGKVMNPEGQPAEFATVIVLKSEFDSTANATKEVVVKAQTTDMDGKFSFEGLPIMSPIKLKISSVGFKELEVPVQFDRPDPSLFSGMKPGQAPDMAVIQKIMAGFNKDLGELTLETDSQMLDGVTVKAAKALMEMDIDKKIFNVEKNIVTAGGTAVDVMRNIPSLQVDIDGNVKLRNAAPTLFIDGRPTTLTLEQIPADAIEKVEVITNPSAKYDASGSMAGILNLVLKKNRKSGFNGMVNIGADNYMGANTMTSLNLRQGKFNVSLMGMGNLMNRNTTGYSQRTSSIGGIDAMSYQDITSETKGMMGFGRLAIDYDLSSKTSFSIGGVMGGGNFNPYEDIMITNTINGVSSVSNRLSESSRQFRPKGLQLGFRQNFATEGEQLTMDFNYFGGTNGNDGIYTTNYLTDGGLITGTQIQKQIGEGQNRFMTFQTDYVKPLKNDGQFETGIRAQLNTLSNLNDNTLKPVGSDVYQDVTSASINFDSDNSVYAAYVSVSGKVGNAFNYKTGLRAESSFYTGQLLNTNESFSNSFPISLFPSIFLSKDLTDTDQLQMSVTRRVNRPNFFQLIPFVDYSDSLNITRGNADLVPEFTTSAELSYSKTIGTGTFLASAYFKHTNNLITQYLGQEVNPISGRLDLINTFINANSSDNYGVELTFTNKVTNWWDFTANANFYNSRINTENIESSIQSEPLWTAFGKLNNNFNLKNSWVIQLSGDYQGKTNVPVSQGRGFGPPSSAQSSSQGYIEPFYGVDIAVKKSFLKDNAGSLTLSANDIFRTRGNTQVSFGEGFSQTYYRLNNPQMIRLNFSLRFGHMDMKMFRRNSNPGAMEGMQMQ
ncbi:TonB-dependent receptor domain-containing protein [Jiulongibacter sediminis]|jgi:outer membrane receptor protein involved in Fe transport|uniref:TonB-dependent receptor domain-containing protein n=1 Tax=Jiulongibacter sediminis TaxID=1605367 RepID=UPI0026ECC0F2|nr:TonB-dependent receptor [Jiulongibacter sediminis]